MEERDSGIYGSTQAAVEAVQHGYQPIPVKSTSKKPLESSWTHTRWKLNDLDAVRRSFERWHSEGAANVGLLLGEPSGGLIDVDLDHPLASRLREYLPPTRMKTGRPGNPISHYWYQVNDELPKTRHYKMPDGSTSLELRSTGSQTLIPPSIWHPRPGEVGIPESYRWEYEDWGEGDESNDIDFRRGPAVVSGPELALTVHVLGMIAVVLEHWPEVGGRHDAYLALAGALLRYGEGVHPWWEEQLPYLIRALAHVTHDRDGADARVSEVMGTTVTRLREGGKVSGWPTLAEIIGDPHAGLARRMAKDIASFAWAGASDIEPGASDPEEEEFKERIKLTSLPPEERNPLAERTSSWEAVDLDPYLLGEVKAPEANVLTRSDDQGLMYEGRLNLLFGTSESAKSWIALIACVQEMSQGGRVVYLDFEDEPVFTLERLEALGVGDDDIRAQFTYLRPEDPLQAMMNRDRYTGMQRSNEKAKANETAFQAVLEQSDPTLIVADGMTVLYGLHGLDTNDATSTDIISTWLKSLTRSGKSTVIVIDHTGKAGGPSPIGAHHKVAMVQGTALFVKVERQPMRGAVGEVKLYVTKDRPGAVRIIATPEKQDKESLKKPVAARVTLDSTTEGVTHYEIKPEEPVRQDAIKADFGGMDAAGERQLANLERETQERTLYRQIAECLVDRGIFEDKENWPSRQDIMAWMLEKFPGVYDQKPDHQWKLTFHSMVKGEWLKQRGTTKGARYALPLRKDSDSSAN